MPQNYSSKVFVSIVLLCSCLLTAQQDSHFALYKYHMHIINPAFTGSQEGAFINSTYRSQWAGVSDAPRIQVISLGIPSTEKRLNYGALFYNDKTFVEQFSRFYANFSYRVSLDSKTDLYLGLSAGGQNFRLNFSSLKNVNPGSDQFLSSFSRFNPNLGVGGYLKTENFYLSLSIPKLFQTKRFNENFGYASSGRDLVHVYGSAGVNIPLTTDWFWVNSGLIRYVQNAPWSILVNSGLAYKNNELTLGYQWDSSVAATLMIQNIGFISVGYSYQFPTGSLASITGGNHELLLKIRLGKSDSAKEVQEETNEEIQNITSAN